MTGGHQGLVQGREWTDDDDDDDDEVGFEDARVYYALCDGGCTIERESRDTREATTLPYDEILILENDQPLKDTQKIVVSV